MLLDEWLLKILTSSETPFFVLFATLFLFTLKRSKDREIKQNEIINGDLKNIKSELSVLIAVWKILLEDELERRKQK